MTQQQAHNQFETPASSQALHFSLLTLFPELLLPFTKEAILGKAVAKGLLSFDLVDLRAYANNKHQKVDDTPYGGGAGMVIRVDVVERALLSLRARASAPPDEVILLTPAGPRFDQQLAEELSQKNHLALLCGRYEGFDARTEHLVTRELSLGDFVMMGGEAAAACIIEAVARLRTGVLGDAASHEQDSFSSGLLDYPEYTRPPVWQPIYPLQGAQGTEAGLMVPEVLLGGNHGAIAAWRRQQAVRRTFERRPDLLGPAPLETLDTETLLACGASSEQLQDWHAPAPRQRRKKRQS